MLSWDDVEATDSQAVSIRRRMEETARAAYERSETMTA